MTEGSAPGHETYMVGGNLLNEQDEILRAKRGHEAAQREAGDIVADEECAADNKVPADAEDDAESEEANGLPGGGATIPEEHADSIAEEQHTHGGGLVPPGDFGDDDGHGAGG